MVIREYQCEHCGIVEVRQNISEDILKNCPKCARPIKQIFHNPTVIWRGNFRWMKGNYGKGPLV